MADSLYFLTLTPKGRGAIAVIAVGGNGIAEALDQCFRPVAQRPITQIDRDIIYGIWDSTGEDLLVVRTGPEQFEIQCHGSQAVLDAISSDLSRCGAKQRNGAATDIDQPADAFRTEIQTLMEQASTERVALLLLKQWSLFPAAVQRLEQNIDAAQLQKSIEEMLALADFGLNLHRARSIVFCGRPNAGKSSLMNQLLGYGRAIVNAMPGTTRDIVSETSAIEGWPVEFSDTAGLRTADGEIEKIGIARAMEKIEMADLIVGVLDPTATTDRSDEALTELHVAPHVVAINKSDLASAQHMDLLSDIITQKWPATKIVRTSAETGNGIDQLLEVMATVLCPALPEENMPFPTTENQLKWLQKRLV